MSVLISTAWHLIGPRFAVTGATTLTPTIEDVEDVRPEATKGLELKPLSGMAIGPTALSPDPEPRVTAVTDLRPQTTPRQLRPRIGRVTED